MRKLWLAAASVLGLGGAAAVLAQTVEGLDLQAIANRAEAQGGELSAMLDQALARGDAERAGAQEVVDAGVRRMKALDPSALPKVAGPVDFDELVAGAQGALAEGKSAPMFIAFASLSMPPDSLKRMIDDVRRAGGVVVFRGFPGNDGRTFAAMMRRVATEGAAANVAIDPRLFRAFDVRAVPTYVVASSDFTPCDGFDCVTPLPPHDRMVGNVTVQYALSSFAGADGPGAAVARVALANLGGKD